METSTFPGLCKYYYVTGLTVWNTFCEIEKHIDDRVQEVLDKYDETDSASSKQTSSNLHYLTVQITNTHRYAMLPMFLGLLERVLKGLSRTADSDSYQQVDQRSWFKSHIAFLRQLGVDFSQVEKEIASVHDLSTLRHCIVHANGEVDLCKDPIKVRASIERTSTAAEFSDGFLQLGDQVIPTAQIANSSILRLVFKHFGHPLDWRKWH